VTRIPLASLDPTHDLDDLEPLVERFASARVVALGESTHYSREFYLLRHRLIRLLVERLGFRALAWESGSAEGFVVDRWLREGGDLAAAQRHFTWSMGLCDEVGDLLEYLRARGDVRFYGIDLPGSMGSLLPALEPLAGYLAEVDPAYGPVVDRLLELARVFGSPNANDGQAQYGAMPLEDRNELTGLLSDTEARIGAQRVAYVEQSGVERYEVAWRHIRAAVTLDRVLRQFRAMFSGNAAMGGPNVRDAAMAEIVEWILGREERLILLAHNQHIQRTPIVLPGLEQLSGASPVGHHLASRLGGDYVTVATTYGAGEILGADYVQEDGVLRLVARPGLAVDAPPEGTLDELLARDAQGPYAVALADLPEAAACTTMRMMENAIPIAPLDAFDVVVHVPELTMWRATSTPMVPHVDNV
jgi:erythromycin esterase